MEEEFGLNLETEEVKTGVIYEESEKTEETASVGDIEAQAIKNPHEWAASLDDSLKNETSLHKFKDVNSLAKSYIELEKTRGKSPFPDAKSTEEERIAFYRKAGIPEPEKYTLDAAKFGLDDAVAGELKELASKNGIPPHALAATLSFIQEKHAIASQGSLEERKALVQEQISSLKKAYGTAYDKYLGLASEVAKSVYSQDELKYLKSSGMTSDPMFVKLLMDRAKTMFGEEMIEDDHTSKGIVATPHAIETRIGEIMSDPDYFNTQSARHNSLVQELEKLYIAKNKI